MTLKLPTPLPYDAVDEMLDETLVFGVEPAADDRVRHWVRRNNRNQNLSWISNVGRTMFQLIEDHSEYEEEQGDYMLWSGSHDAMVWEAKPLTEHELDKLMEEIFGEQDT